MRFILVGRFKIGWLICCSNYGTSSCNIFYIRFAKKKISAYLWIVPDGTWRTNTQMKPQWKNRSHIVGCCCSRFYCHTLTHILAADIFICVRFFLLTVFTFTRKFRFNFNSSYTYVNTLTWDWVAQQPIGYCISIWKVSIAISLHLIYKCVCVCMCVFHFHLKNRKRLI